MKHLTVLLDGSIQRQFIGLMFGRREDHGTTKHATVNLGRRGGNSEDGENIYEGMGGQI